MNMELIVWGLQACLGGFGAVLWSVFNDLKKRHEELEDEFILSAKAAAKELADYKADSAAKFLTREEMKHAVESINQTLDRHAGRMDTRLDRLEERLMEIRRAP